MPSIMGTHLRQRADCHCQTRTKIFFCKDFIFPSYFNESSQILAFVVGIREIRATFTLNNIWHIAIHSIYWSSEANAWAVTQIIGHRRVPRPGVALRSGWPECVSVLVAWILR